MWQVIYITTRRNIKKVFFFRFVGSRILRTSKTKINKYAYILRLMYFMFKNHLWTNTLLLHKPVKISLFQTLKRFLFCNVDLDTLYEFWFVHSFFRIMDIYFYSSCRRPTIKKTQIFITFMKKKS